jgi:hypothetical protein
LTARALALPSLEQRDLRLQKLLKHDAIPVEAGIGNTDIESRCSPWTNEGFVFRIGSWVEEVLCVLRACSDGERLGRRRRQDTIETFLASRF